jgi:invasion protein IalB
MIAALFSVLLLAAETPAAAPEAATAPVQESLPAAAPNEKAEKEKKICRVNPADTGSRMKKKLCLTQNEWDMRSKGRTVGDLKAVGAR